MNTQTEALKLALEAYIKAGVGNSTDFVLQGKAYDLAIGALAQPSDSVEQEPEVCCGDYATCIKPCTPRGRWLAQPVQKPVAWMCAPFGDTEYEFSAHQECENCVPCYTTPPKREWVGLTDEEIDLLEGYGAFWVDHTPLDFAKLIEAKLKEKNA